MAAPDTLSFAKGVLYFGDGATPTEIFTKLCGLKSVTVKWDKKTNETEVPDCDDPDAPVWLEREVVSQSASLSASGVCAKASLPKIHEMFLSAAGRRWRYDVADAGTGSGTPNLRLQGRFHISYEIKAERGSKVELSITAESSGEVTLASIA